MVSTLYSLERRSELKPDWHKQWDPDPGHITGIQNDKIYTILSAASEETRVDEMTRANEMNVESCMELDSHANMPVVGKHAYIIAETSKKVDVSPFKPDYKPLTVPLVDAMVKYEPDWHKQWDPDPGHITGIRNDKIYTILSTASEETRVNEMTRANEMNVESRTELDSHANMPVVGKHAYIIAETSKKVDVSPFKPDYKPLTVPLVDATVKYDNPYNRKSYILVLRNALYVPLMDNNLIPPFMLREMGVTVNDIPKIHKEDPTVDDHAITFVETGFRIPLSLWGIFSYFPMSKPTHDDLLNPNEVYILSPATWNPHSDAYSTNEESMLDWEGNMQPKNDCQYQIVLDDVEDDINMVASLLITLLEQEAIDTHLVEDDE